MGLHFMVLNMRIRDKIIKFKVLLLKKRLVKIILSVFSLILLMVVILNLILSFTTRKYVYNNLADLPYHKAGLVLGTSQYDQQGRINMYFYYRIIAAVELYKAGKIDYLIVSGDNSHLKYNEPLLMKKELVNRGVPACQIILDFAGFRTLDSVVRCSEVFGQDDYTVISQEFQNRRAIFIGRHFHIKMTGYNARNVYSFISYKIKFREIFARVKVFIDLYITKQSPKFLGEKIDISN